MMSVEIAKLKDLVNQWDAASLQMAKEASEESDRVRRAWKSHQSYYIAEMASQLQAQIDSA